VEVIEAHFDARMTSKAVGREIAHARSCVVRAALWMVLASEARDRTRPAGAQTAARTALGRCACAAYAAPRGAFHRLPCARRSSGARRQPRQQRVRTSACARPCADT
jgi:hypothetical protein